MRSRIYLVILGILALALVAAGCGKKADAPAAENSDSSALAEGGDPEKGKTVYANCLACHGAKGEGGVGLPFVATPGNARAEKPVDERLSEADHIATVTDGRADKGMPGWKGTLSDDDIRNVVAYEREVLAKGNQ